MQAIASLCDRALLLRPNGSPIVGDVGEITALYASINGNATDPRIRVRDFKLAERSGAAPLRAALEPGSHLTLDLQVETNVPLPRCSLIFEVVRTDGLVVFNGSPMAEGDLPIDLRKGETLRARIQFRANVLRGTYGINVHLADVQRLWPPIAISGLGSFVVHETTRVSGCAELEPRYRIDVSAEAPMLRVVGHSA